MLNLVNWTLAASNVVDTNDGSISGYVTYNLDKPLSNDIACYRTAVQMYPSRMVVANTTTNSNPQP